MCGQVIERRIGIDAGAEFGAFRTKAGCQVSYPLRAPKGQLSWSWKIGQVAKVYSAR